MARSPTRPRFPYFAAAMCTACVVVAGWTWMRYSYCWRVSIADLATPASGARPLGRYVRVTGYLHARWSQTCGGPGEGVLLRDPSVEVGQGAARGIALLPAVFVRPTGDADDIGWRAGEPDVTLTVAGRVIENRISHGQCTLGLDAAASRFYPASITGLVIGTVGVGVFAFFLVRWLNRRGQTVSPDARGASVP